MNKKTTFFVDIAETMIGTKNLGAREDCQKMFCKCGHSETFSFKIKRVLVKNFDELIEGEESIDNVSCKKCGNVYNHKNKTILLSPDREELYFIEYVPETTTNSKGHILYNLYRKKSFALYDKKSGNIKFREDVDFIRFNKTTKEINLFVTPPHETDIVNSKKINEGETAFINLNITNLKLIKLFFSYKEYIKFSGLENVFHFLKEMDNMIIDLESFKKEISISYIYKNFKIETKVDKNGEEEFYHEIPSGFNDGKTYLRRLDIGDYLLSLYKLTRLFVASINFPSISTIYLTKSFDFMNAFLDSNNVCNPCVYIANNATYPTGIMEVSTNFDQTGVRKLSKPETSERVKNKKSITEPLKISKLLYKNINDPTDMDILLEAFQMRMVNKEELETMFQLYENNRVYKILRAITKSNNRHGISLTFKHITHILDYRLDEMKQDFLTVYTDTINMLGLLSLNEKEIFKLKNFKELKEAHDDFTARYNAVKDLKKAEFFKKAVEVFAPMNMVINDIAFTVVPTIEALNKEGLTLGHCIYTYLTRICERKYVAVNVQHLISNERATLGLIREGDKLSFEQLKGYQNSRASSEVINATMKFIEENKIGLSKSTMFNNDLQPSPTLRKRMGDYLSDEEVARIRKKREEERIEKGEPKKGIKPGSKSNEKNVENKTEPKSGKKLFNNLFGLV